MVNNSGLNSALVGERGSVVTDTIGVPETTDIVIMPQGIDSTLPVVDSQVVLQSKIDSVSIPDTIKHIRSHSKTEKERGFIASSKESRSAGSKTSGCMDLSGNPLTAGEALQCSMHHRDVASVLLSQGNADSALMHCGRAIALNENGSLFYLKAKILNNLFRWSDALQAAQISLQRNDHWAPYDKYGAWHEKCIALQKLNEVFPSSKLQEEIIAWRKRRPR